jgi:hypothetical protein
VSYRTWAIAAVVFMGAASGCDYGSHGYDSYCYEDGYCGDPYPSGYDDGYGGTGGGGPAGAAGGTAGGWSGAGGSGMYCESDSECGPAMVCSPLDGCEPIVANCPLTPECIGDPDGYAPEWQGWDPLYAGSMIGGDTRALVDAHLDFYDTHLYGEAVLLFPQSYDVVQVIVTGTRQGDKVYGQFVEVDGFRTFDAVYEATMPSASEMVGTVTIASDLGEWVAEMHLYRTSPCGCAVEATGCTQSSDCPNGSVCLDAACVQLCGSDADCADPSLQCVNNVCEPAEAPISCDPPCADGAVCVDGGCQTSCTHSCDCSSGEVCTDGVCAPAPSSLLPRACETDCDCAYADGEMCENGYCEGT